MKFLVLVVACVIFPRTASAHKDDYTGETLVYLTLEKREIEAEYWFDLVSQSAWSDPFARHNLAMELGITDHWMLDGRLTIGKRPSMSNTGLNSGRLETRYRFFDEGTLPTDIAVSGEVNWQRTAEGSTVSALEPRLVFSKDFGVVNLTLNLAEEVALESGSTSFLPAVGFRYNWSNFLRFGGEFQYDSEEHVGSLIPQVWFALPYSTTFKIGYSQGIDRSREDFLRLALEIEF